MLRNGAHAPAFETILASGPNSAVPHHRPTERELVFRARAAGCAVLDVDVEVTDVDAAARGMIEDAGTARMRARQGHRARPRARRLARGSTRLRRCA